MKQPLHTLAFIKHQAKKLKKQLNISYTSALELTAKQLGYSNWQHCQRSISQQSSLGIEAANIHQQPEISFTAWLRKHKNRNSPLGDLAQDMLSDENWPSHDTLEDYSAYLNSQHASYAAIETLERAWKSYKAYLKRLKNPKKQIPSKDITTPKKPDIRKIIFVKNAKPIPYPDRTIEKFSPGDLAWVSWNGRKAIPVIITEVDDERYSFKNVL